MLRDDINTALKEAMKAKNERAVSTLRMVNSTLKNADIEARGSGKPALGDAEVVAALQKMVKQRQESVELYKKGGRDDLAKQEQEEIEIISGYLPKQMSEGEMTAAIEAAIAETGAASMKDMGKVIGSLRAKHAGQMDMGKASALVKAKLLG
ncbi:MAG: GatB/YqeY domain-containing protein [Pseudolabrys sp.]